MIEPEMAFADLDDNMDLAEAMLKYVINYVLENAPEAKPGDEVVCIGRQKDRFIPFEEWAQLKGTHVYDLLCSIGMRVRRRYLGR